MRANRLVVVLTAVAALTAGLAACSSDDDGGGSRPSPAVAATAVQVGPPTGWSAGGFAPDTAKLKCGQTASDPTRGITDTEITVGGLAYLTSPNGSSMAGTELGAKARFERANAEGGV